MRLKVSVMPSRSMPSVSTLQLRATDVLRSLLTQNSLMNPVKEPLCHRLPSGRSKIPAP